MLERVRGHGVPVYEGYGLSECASVVSLNTPGHDRAGTSGKVLPHVQVSVVDDELEISGNTFLGYLGEPETWHQRPVQTGDIGHVDDEGYITVQGRRKNVLISSFGRNISPEWVESELLADGMFQQAVVLGDARPWCVALLVPRDQAMPDARLQAQLDAVNSNLPDYAQIREWRRLPEPLTAPNGMLTANGRPRRQTIDQQYAGLIDQMYGEAKELSAL
jgi:long-subunit acyl-CoA synthetase (AMP-forming)